MAENNTIYIEEDNRKKARAARTTKKQIEIILNYYEQNPNLLTGRLDGREAQNMEKRWRELTDLLNNSGQGAVKTLSGWKQAFGELKTNLKRRAREVHVANTGTGRGPSSVKDLTEVDERFLGLISRVVVEGAPITEPGLNENLVAYNPEMLLEYIEVNAINSIQEVKAACPDGLLQRQKRTPRTNISNPSYNIRELWQNIASQTTSMDNLATSIEHLSKSIFAMAQALEKMASAMADQN